MDRKPAPARKPALEVLQDFMDSEGIEIILKPPIAFHGQNEMLIKLPNPPYQAVYKDELPHGESN